MAVAVAVAVAGIVHDSLSLSFQCSADQPHIWIDDHTTAHLLPRAGSLSTEYAWRWLQLCLSTKRSICSCHCSIAVCPAAIQVIDVVPFASTLTLFYNITVVVDYVNQAPIYVGVNPVVFLDRMDFRRFELIYTLPMWDINGETCTFSYNSSDLTNTTGEQAVALWTNGELRSVGWLDYYQGKDLLWIDVIATDNGVPPLSSYFRLNLTVTRESLPCHARPVCANASLAS